VFPLKCRPLLRVIVLIGMNRSLALGTPSLCGLLLRCASLPVIVRAGAAVVVAVVPFAAYAINILHSFYDVGSSFHDAGWSAYLLHDGDLLLHGPPCVDGGSSWFNSHVSPLFIVTSLLGGLVPLTRIQFYAAFVGISHALPAIAVFWLLTSGYRMTRPAACLIAAALALLFAFDGLALAIARYPHFMMFVVGTGMMFLAALALRRTGIALVFFVLCLGTREDAGFHLFALLSLSLAWQWWRGVGWREQRPVAAFALAALLYSSSIVALQHALGGDYSVFAIEYIGSPPFAGVSLSSIGERLLGWMAFRGYVMMPALAALIWAIVRRNPVVVLGYAAFVPWGMLHLVAAREIQGTLPAYYAFPYMFASFWPLAGLLIERRGAPRDRSILEPICGFALLTAASFVPSPYQGNPTHIDLPAGFVALPSAARQAATDQALKELGQMTELGRVVADESVIAVTPEFYRDDQFLSPAAGRDVDSVIYFAHGFQGALARETAASAALGYVYGVRGTEVRVATKRPIDRPGGLTLLPASE
jgi:hypothetical protein